MMKIDAEIICRKEPYGVVCKWTGGKVAKMQGDYIHEKRMKAGDVYEYGRLNLRIVAWPFFNECGAACDSAAVMLESPHAQLFWLYRENAERLARFTCNAEARLRSAWCGLCLRPFPEGKIMPFAAWLADRLL